MVGQPKTKLKDKNGNEIMIIRVKVFKNGPSKVCERLSSTNFTWSILEYFVPYEMVVTTRFLVIGITEIAKIR